MEIRLVDARTGRKLGEAEKGQALITGDTLDIGGTTYRIKRVDVYNETARATVVWLVKEAK